VNRYTRSAGAAAAVVLAVQAGDTQAQRETSPGGSAPAGLADRIEIKGRVFTCVEYERFRSSAGDSPLTDGMLAASVPSGRAGLKASGPGGLSVVLEAEFTGRPDMRDGYVQARGKPWSGRIGRFKQPISSFSLESVFALPLARRGQFEEILSDAMLVTGRRESLMVGVKGGGYWDPELVAALAQPVRWGPSGNDPLTVARPSHLSGVARFTLKPSGMELGLVAQRRVTYAGRRGTPVGALRQRAFWTLAADSAVDVERHGTGFRFWTDGFTGSSWFDQRTGAFDGEGEADATNWFVGGRALAGFRWGGLVRGAGYVEMFAAVAILEPDVTVTSDLLVEGMAGLTSDGGGRCA
jgi:hypothetical protein